MRNCTKKVIRSIGVLAMCAGVLLLAACGGYPDSSMPEDAAPAAAESTALAATSTNTEGIEENDESKEKVMVEMVMKNGGVIKLELDPEAAPITVENFVKLAGEGFYDGLVFHRVVKDFMIQGGDPDGNGTGGPGYGIKGEFASNGWDANTISHTKGVISMARSGNPDSAGSQFFITHGDASFLDGDYAAFGSVVEGMDVVDRIATADTDWDSSGREKSVPLEPEVIETIRVLEA